MDTSGRTAPAAPAAIFDAAIFNKAAAGWSGPLPRAVERVALAVGRLDHAVTEHPLRSAWAHRTRLTAACRHAAIDGHVVDPHRLAAVIEGLRLTSSPAVALLDRAAGYLALRHAVRLYGWMLAANVPDVPGSNENDADTESAVQLREIAAALTHFRSMPADIPALVAAGLGLRSGLEADIERGPLRAALPRYLMDRRVTHSLLPVITGSDALHGGGSNETTVWLTIFLDAVAREAEDGLRRLATLTRSWTAAHATLAGRGGLAGRRAVRSDAALPRAVDLLAAAPFLGPAQLARVLGCSVRGASLMLTELVELGVAVEVTGRASHRLFALPDLGPVRSHTAGPKRASGRKPGRPSGGASGALSEGGADSAPAPTTVAPMRLPERPILAVDFDALFADTDRAIRRVQAILATSSGSGQ